MEERYGPMSAEIGRLLATVDLLDEDRVKAIALAYREQGMPHQKWAWSAAQAAGREREVGEAAWDMTKHIQMYGITYMGSPEDVRLVAWAGNNAGLGIATEDLIGTARYSIEEYARLVDPWFAGFKDQPIVYGEELA
jgi:hypothetical protein